MKLFCVVNMDIIGSRKTSDRNKLRNTIIASINLIQTKYADLFAAPIAITLGDEWQLITHEPSEAYNLVHEFQQLMWNEGFELYAGIGIGRLSTYVSDDIRNMDGSCFHAAREALNIAKSIHKLKNKYTINKANKIFFLSSFIAEQYDSFQLLDLLYTSKTGMNNKALSEVAATMEECQDKQTCISNDVFMLKAINLLIENNELLKSKMTDKQRKVYISYLKLGSYRKVAEVSDGKSYETIGNISQKLNSASYFTIQRNHSLVSMLLGMYSGMEG